MAFHLRRVQDGAGDSGGSSQSISWNKETNKIEVDGYIPKIGNVMKVGNVTARSYSRQDYWLTTEVTEILEEIKNDDVYYVRFSTGNSEYEWWNGVYPKDTPQQP